MICVRDFAVGHFQMVAILGSKVKSSQQWERVICSVLEGKNRSSWLVMREEWSCMCPPHVIWWMKKFCRPHTKVKKSWKLKGRLASFAMQMQGCFETAAALRCDAKDSDSRVQWTVLKSASEDKVGAQCKAKHKQRYRLQMGQWTELVLSRFSPALLWNLPPPSLSSSIHIKCFKVWRLQINGCEAFV